MNRLKELREKTGKNMKDVAKELNLPYTTYVNYEKGNREPNSEMLIVMAKYYGVSVDYLIGRSVGSAITPKETGPVRPVDKVIIYHRDGKTKEEYLTKEQLEYVSKFIESIKDIKPKEDL